jgi:hypothetical protein
VPKVTIYQWQIGDAVVMASTDAGALGAAEPSPPEGRFVLEGVADIDDPALAEFIAELFGTSP